ncbi:alanine--tRNA ligase [Nocardioides sp. dk4132]|uniref:alanine--tRNA ligase n=1 Tax=unclassified Nocardioides TaxID=2615069 RepID=UPI001295BF61|nr:MULTISPECIES: alanine--tRNA ligase [unclassified Nocardioides]MQW74930.1 alanine--tRNA ligase [Nocardioides sp. dk4132]QGA07882.1 alanine--tRNA ligase [Nocardioides sp. dk884]
METAEIRRRFVAHFERHAHTVVPSASLLLDDPNLLFVNAGMVPFKPYFLGQETAPYDRAVSVQKCVRTLDIEEVGKTTRHGTFFQMCGNFSFGDYFKEGAIRFAWELITGSVADGGLGFDPEKIWVTVLPSDTEAKQLWREVAGLPDERIQERGLKDNYWNMGVPGPGGPCSEIYVDRGPEYGPDGGPNADEDRFLEIWNLVFMQESLSAVRAKDDFDVEGPLPAQNIDTGMGLERVAYLLQGKQNMYEIDEVFPVIQRASELTGRAYGADEQDDVRFRVVADHVRSALMLIGDGVTPGNEGRGYVLRRLLRRAVRSMRLLGFEDRALPELLPVSMSKMKVSYPELESGFERISRVAYAEEDAFRKTLAAGTQIFDQAAQEVRSSGSTTLAGAKAFALHDTYGFPIDLTLEMASEAGLQVDESGFRALMAEQRERAKADARAKKGQHADTGVYRGILDAHGPTEWLAYETLETESRALAVLRGGERAGALTEGEVGELVLDRTPFYAESGGQAADAGVIEFDGGKLEVLDVQRPVRGLVVHQVRVLEGELDPERALHAKVDPEWRTGARQAHSGTHVVHAALRQVLGPSALQSGSYNRPGYLRLDFGWTQGLTPAQVRDIEQVSNEALRADLPVGWQYMTLAEAKEWGAIALFGETYDDTKVRVVEIGGPWSRELCGGTHVDHSSQIGTLVVTGESSVGSGNRRIEAFTGLEGFAYLARERDVVGQLTGLLKAQPDDLVGRVSELVERLKSAEKEVEKARLSQILAAAGELAAGAQDVDGVAVVAHRVDGAGGGDVRTLAMDIRSRLGAGRPAVVVVIGVADGKVSVVAATNEAARERGLSANGLVRAVGPLLGGKGGGKDDVAQGGGTDTSRVDEALGVVAADVARTVSGA